MIIYEIKRYLLSILKWHSFEPVSWIIAIMRANKIMLETFLAAKHAQCAHVRSNPIAAINCSSVDRRQEPATPILKCFSPEPISRRESPGVEWRWPRSVARSHSESTREKLERIPKYIYAGSRRGCEGTVRHSRDGSSALNPDITATYPVRPTIVYGARYSISLSRESDIEGECPTTPARASFDFHIRVTF